MNGRKVALALVPAMLLPAQSGVRIAGDPGRQRRLTMKTMGIGATAALSVLVALPGGALAAPQGEATPLGEAKTYQEFFPGCRQRTFDMYPNDYSGPGAREAFHERCTAAWQTVQSLSQLAPTLLQATSLAQRGVPDAPSLAKALTAVTWRHGGAGRAWSGGVGGKEGGFGVEIPEGKLRQLRMSMDLGVIENVDLDLAQSLRAQGATVERIACYDGGMGGGRHEVFKVAGAGSGNREFALRLQRDYAGRGNQAFEVVLALDGLIPTREQLRREFAASDFEFTACDG